MVEAVRPARAAPRREATIEEWLATPEEARAELIGGRLGDAVRAPPFDSVELMVSELLGEDEAEEPVAEEPAPEETP